MITPYPFSSLESLAHFFFASPVIIFGILQLVDHFHISQRKFLTSFAESLFVTGLGVFIFVGELLALSGCKPHSHCASVNIMHSLFGLMILEVGILYILLHTDMMKHSFNYFRFLALSLVGLFMLLHDQPSDYALLIHQAYGLSCILAGISETIAVVYPSFIPCAVTLLVISQTLFLFGPDSVEEFFAKQQIMPHNALFLAVCIALGIVCIATTAMWYYARYAKIEFNHHEENDAPTKLR